ncbi:MAG: hypothetical protein ABI634_20080 [Acidobacteriota bacterium]
MATQALPISQAQASRGNIGVLLGELVIRGIGLGLAGAGVILGAALASLYFP